MGLMQTIKSSSKQIFKTVKNGAVEHGPQIAIYAGLATVIVGGVLACKQTLTIDEVEEKHKKKLEHIDATLKDDILKGEYTEEEATKDKAKVMVAMGTDILKHYALPLGLVTAGSGAILWGTNKMSKRISVLTTSVGTLTAFISDYRKRVQDEVGVEKENDIFLGKKEVEVVDEETGEVKKKTTIDIRKNPFCEWWGPVNSDGRINGTFVSKSPMTNLWNWSRYELMYQEKMEAALARGEVAVLYVNDIYEDFDIPTYGNPKAVARRNSGWAWIKDENGKIISLTGGATRISIGVPRDEKGNVITSKVVDTYDYQNDPAFKGDQKDVDETLSEPLLINPNCDGDITSALYEYYEKADAKRKRRFGHR